MALIDLKILHILLLVVILIVFSKLTIDACFLGAICVFLWQERRTYA